MRPSKGNVKNVLKVLNVPVLSRSVLAAKSVHEREQERKRRGITLADRSISLRV